jgi:hypothetical protein
MLSVDNLEPSLITKYSISRYVLGTSFEYMELPGGSFFDDFVALCHAVPLTKNIRFTYN